jgi:hypothetical protein
VAQKPLVGGNLIVEASRSYTHTHTQSIGLLWTGDQPYQRSLPDNTQHSRETDINAPGEIPTHNPKKRVAADHAATANGKKANNNIKIMGR